MEIRFHTSPKNISYAGTFIVEQDFKAKEHIWLKFREYNKLLRKYGYKALKAMDINNISNGIREIRIRFNNAFYRFTYVIRKGIIWILSAFKKKTKKTPKGEVELAIKRMKDLDDRVIPCLAI